MTQRQISAMQTVEAMDDLFANMPMRMVIKMAEATNGRDSLFSDGGADPMFHALGLMALRAPGAGLALLDAVFGLSRVDRHLLIGAWAELHDGLGETDGNLLRLTTRLSIALLAFAEEADQDPDDSELPSVPDDLSGLDL